MSTENLTNLRKIAEEATSGPWTEFHENGTPGEYEAFNCPPATGAMLLNYAPMEQRAKDSRFIATFDPPTVLELLDRAERAEAKLITQTRVLKTIAKRNVSLASDRAKMVWNLEQAEATIQRVREVATEMAGHTMPEGPKGSAWILAEGAQLFAKDVLEALDTTP